MDRLGKGRVSWVVRWKIFRELLASVGGEGEGDDWESGDGSEIESCRVVAGQLSSLEGMRRFVDGRFGFS